MLSAPIAVQSFEAVARQSPQIVEPFRRVDGEKLGSRSALNLVRQSFDRVAGKQRCRSLVGEASDHECNTYRVTVRMSSFVRTVNRYEPTASIERDMRTLCYEKQ